MADVRLGDSAPFDATSKNTTVHVPGEHRETTSFCPSGEKATPPARPVPRVVVRELLLVRSRTTVLDCGVAPLELPPMQLPAVSLERTSAARRPSGLTAKLTASPSA